MMAWYWHGHDGGVGTWLWLAWMVLFWGGLLAAGVYFIRLRSSSDAPATGSEAWNVDDQGVWLDDRTIGYGKVDPGSGRVGVWSVPADGSGTPRLLAADAESPSAPTEGPR